MRCALISTCALVLLAASVGAMENCTGVVNPFPVNTAAPILNKTVRNGKLFTAGQGNDTFSVLHLYGSHYEMGYAHGQLMGPTFPEMWSIFITYIEGLIQQQDKSIPQWLIDLVAQYGFPAALQLTVDWTKPFTPQKYIDEMHGIADGSGFPFDQVYQLNMFPELIKAACTIVGATKSSTANGQISHLRDLDIDATMPIKNWPLVAVLHGDGTESAVINFGWSMLVGSLTGISNNPIGIGEKVWLHQSKDDGVKGQPWMFILRDVLYTKNIDEALATMANATRTCAIHVGVGDGVTNEFRGVQMDAKNFEVFNWSSINYPEHPIIKDVMYWDRHAQPTTHWCLSTMLKQYYGNITAEMLALQVSGYGQTGNFHSVAFDYGKMTAYFANARKTFVSEGGLNAYERQYTLLDLNALFAEPRP